MSKFAGTVFDPATPAITRVSRVGAAAVVSTCAMLFYMLLTL